MKKHNHTNVLQYIKKIFSEKSNITLLISIISFIMGLFLSISSFIQNYDDRKRAESIILATKPALTLNGEPINLVDNNKYLLDYNIILPAKIENDKSITFPIGGENKLKKDLINDYNIGELIKSILKKLKFNGGYLHDAEFPIIISCEYIYNAKKYNSKDVYKLKFDSFTSDIQLTIFKNPVQITNILFYEKYTFNIKPEIYLDKILDDEIKKWENISATIEIK